jgi:S1-C subfamily serine protease
MNQNIQQRTVQFVFVAQVLNQYPAASYSIQEHYYPAGTGILVNDVGYVVTADHLIDMWAQFVQQSPAQIKKVVIVIPSKPDDSSSHLPGPHATLVYDFDVVARDEKHDLALLKLNLTSENSPFLAETLHGFDFPQGTKMVLSIGDAPFSKNISPNSSIAMTGYSSYEFYGGFETKTGKVISGEIPDIATSELTDTVGLAVSSLNVPYTISDYYQTDIASNKLFSGSPVYSAKNGDIIGMCINIANSSETSVIIPSRYVLDLLKNNSVNIK